MKRGGGWGALGIRGCVTVLVNGRYIVLDNIRTYGILYTVRTASYSVSSNQGIASGERSLKISEKQIPLPTFKNSGNMGRE